MTVVSEPEKILEDTCWKTDHLKWLKNTGEKLKTVDGKTVEVWEFYFENDDSVLSAWAGHFRNHYCLDTEIEYYRRGYKCSRTEYLNRIKFPDASNAPGPSIRAGDFGEILIADFLQYVMGYWVPRTRYADKNVRNESTKGCDIVGFKVINGDKQSPEDVLAIFESKAQFSGGSALPRLQDAINDSIKDHTRKAESLNSIKQRLHDREKENEAVLIERFQNIEDNPYIEISGAAALFSMEIYDPSVILSSTTEKHPNSDNLFLIVIRGNNLMNLIHDLYKRAADEA